MTFYRADPSDPDAPVLLPEYRGIRPGDAVAYENPAMRSPDGTFRTMGMDGPLVVTELWDFGAGFETAILNGGQYECSAANLRKLDEQP